MNNNVKPSEIAKKVEEIQKEIPNLIVPTMGIISENNKILVEYVLIISLVTVVAIAAVRIFGGYLKDSVTKMSCEMIGKKYIEGKKVGEAYCEGDEDKVFN